MPNTDGKIDDLDTQRERIRASLDAIVNEVGMAMRDEGLNFPLYVTVPTQGHAVATIATPLDPSDSDWRRASEIFCRVTERTTGCERLRGKELVCAIANAGSVTADDITQD